MGKSSSPCPGVVSAAVAPRRKGRQPLFPAVLSPLPDQSANGVGGLHRCSSMAASSSTQPKRRTTLFFAGEIVGCTNLNASGAQCKYWLVTGSTPWKRVAGRAEGTSHADAPAEGENMMVFQHPISVCYEANGLATDHDWPRLEVEVRWLDDSGRSDLAGYGVCPMPKRPGVHELECRVWRPKGKFNLSQFFLGGAPALKDNALRYGLTDENETGALRLMRGVGRSRLKSVPSGIVHIRMNVTTRTVALTGDE